MDVIVVGGGVLGTMHAWFAVQRGHRVVQIERDAEARSATVRNFGLVWVSGRRDGVELGLAVRARELWGDIGRRVPQVGFRPHGSLTVATSAAELSVMAEYAATAGATDRNTVLVDADDVRRINPAVSGELLGALHCRSDAIVESRVAMPALRAAMQESGRYEFVARRNVVDRDGTTVVDHLGHRHRADRLVICPGAVHDALAADHLAHAPLQRCQLQMMQTEPLDVALTTSVADVDSMRYYPAYDSVDLTPLGPQAAVAAESHMQLLLVQRLDGSLTIGDTHRYDRPDCDRPNDDGPNDDGPLPFDVDEAPYEYLVERAAAILGRALPPVRRRWSGIYSQLTPEAAADVVYHHATIDPGVVVVTGPGGRGMTLAPAIAERTWEDLA